MKTTVMLLISLVLAFLGALVGDVWLVAGFFLAAAGTIGLALASRSVGILVFMVVVLIIVGVSSFSWNWEKLFDLSWIGGWRLPSVVFDMSEAGSEEERFLGSYDGITSVSINVAGVEVEFERLRNDVEVYEKIGKIRVERTGDRLEVSANPFTKKARALIKTGSLESVDINGAGVVVKGNIDVRDLKITGAGVEISGTLRCETLEIDGAGAEIDIEVVRCDRMNIDAAGIDGVIRFTEPWKGVRTIDVSAAGADLKIVIPEGVDRDQLRITGGRFGKIVVEEERP